MARILTALPFVSRKFARRPQVSVVMGPQGRKMHVPVRGILLTVAAIAVAGGGFWLWKAQLFAIKTVVVQETVNVQPDVVSEISLQHTTESEFNKSLLWLPTDTLAAHWQAAYPAIAKVEVSKVYPSTLVVNYTPRVALCQLQTPTGTYLVDRDGLIFAKAQSDRLPTLIAEIKPVIGKSISAQGVALGLQLVQGLRSATPKLQRVTLHDGQLDVQLASNPLILVSQDQNGDQMLLQIKTLLAKFAADNSYPQQLDMRYDRPILRY